MKFLQLSCLVLLMSVVLFSFVQGDGNDTSVEDEDEDEDMSVESGSGELEGNSTDNSTIEIWESTTSIDYSLLTCEGYTSALTCPDNHVLHVIEAFWGRNDTVTCAGNERAVQVMCNQSWALDEVRYRCEGKESCDLPASIGVFGDPCDGEVLPMRYLMVDYRCQRTAIRGLMCEASGRLAISCPKNQLISTNGAFFGRDDNVTCYHPTAMHNTSCWTSNAGQVFKGRCDGKKSCELNPTSTEFGDPCPNSYKMLWFSYTCMECKNNHGSDADCEYWANLGDCVYNPTWMATNCRKACWKCDTEEPVCRNAYGNDTTCNAMAASGECSSNPAWMHAYCKKACMQCETACYDKHAPAKCNKWYTEKECSANQNFMFANCTGSCFGCSGGSVECRNIYGDDYQCDQWANDGECDRNAGFMIPNCFRSCMGCTKNPVCENVHPYDSECDTWAFDGECEKYPVWMHKNCWRSCIKCQAPATCENVEDHLTCEDWAADGECQNNPAYMYTNCRLSCTWCKSFQSLDTCMNAHANDGECDSWAANGECFTNPAWMYPSCRKSCTNCDYSSIQSTMVGNAAMPGEVNSMTSGKTVLLPGSFPVDARFTHFTGFFVNWNPVYLQIWRPYTDGLEVVFSQRVWPYAKNYVQTIPAESCLYVQPGDRFGFTSLWGPAPVASVYNMDSAYWTTQTKTATSEGGFTDFSLPFTFSISAAYDEYGSC